MIDEVVKVVNVDEVLSEDVKDEPDEIDVAVEVVKVNDESGENEVVEDEVGGVVLIVDVDVQDEVDVDVVDECAKVEEDVDAKVAVDVHVEDVVDDVV